MTKKYVILDAKNNLTRLAAGAHSAEVLFDLCRCLPPCCEMAAKPGDPTEIKEHFSCHQTAEQHATQTPQLDLIGLWRFASYIDKSLAPVALVRLNGRPNYNTVDVATATFILPRARNYERKSSQLAGAEQPLKRHAPKSKRPYRLTHKRPFWRDVVQLDLISVAGDAETGATQTEQLARAKSRRTHLKTGENGEPLRPESYRQMR